MLDKVQTRNKVPVPKDLVRQKMGQTHFVGKRGAQRYQNSKRLFVRQIENKISKAISSVF